MRKDKTRVELPANHRAEHRVIRDTLGRGKRGPSLNDLIETGEIDPDTITTVDDYERFQEMIVRLKEERRRQGLSLRAVAERMGPGSRLDAPALSRLEKGENDNPTINTVSAYARALNMRIVWDFEKVSNESA